MEYVTLLVHSFIVILLNPILCVPMIFIYDFLLINLMFSTYSNSSHVTPTYLFTIARYCIHFTHPSSPLSLSHPFPSQLPSLPTVSIYYSLPGLIVQPNDIMTWSFGSILHLFGSQLKLSSAGVVHHYMLETSALYFCIASHFHSRLSIYFIKLSHAFYHLHHLHHCSPHTSSFISRIKPFVHRVITFFYDHQPYHYAEDWHELTVFQYVTHIKKRCQDNVM